ncbi:beta-lactamase class A [Saccharopolyspora lacisalsi]|uniref:Beta-lactamase class A n=1 Tax=Halosaccharopolyspora lacisalsi TaxID=1000566 RepID=A0A839DSC0_9PSEU|nr:serine hydrolase [Halosaccharopolyspora lacisalsi]MBA8824404.1 beta-lactamase class A [Halosaccharopolyspora lacisalsi]
MTFAERLRELLPDPAEFPGRTSIAAWVLDESDAVTWDSRRPVQAASTIKVLILIAMLRRVRDGGQSLDVELRLPEPERRVGGTGVLGELTSVDRLSLADLLTLMIVVSDNTATNIVIDLLGVEAIDACARDLGCTDTRVQRHLMDVDAMLDGLDNTTTAMDQARVLDALARGTALPEDLTRYALDVLSRQQVRDRLPALLPVSARCWNKTGEQPALRHDVGLIGTGERPRAVVAVLVDELTDERSRTDYRGGPACDLIADLGARVHAALR